MKGRVCVDTNVLIYSFKNRLDLIKHLEEKGFMEFFVPENIYLELKKLSKILKGADKISARLALLLIEKRFRIVRTNSKKADDSLIELCLDYDCVLITNDRVLIKRARERGIQVGFLRGRRRIEL